MSAYLKIGQNSSQTITIDLNGHTLQRTGLASASANGHVIEVFGAGNLTLENGTLTGGWANNGGGICNYGQVTLNNVTITNCKAVNGGGIINNSGKTLTINGGSIINCRSDAGGGALVNHGTATIDGCNLSNNTATTRGGAIWSDDDLYVYNSTFSGNNALANGGNYQNEGDGGAIHIEGGNANLFSVAITNNTSKDAGAIYVTTGANLYIYGNDETNTTISGNTSSEHGGGGIVNNGYLSLNGDISITSNTCHTNGGGIWDNGTLYIVGNVQVKDNMVDDLFLKSGKVIDVSYPITSGANSIGVPMEDLRGVFTSGYGASMDGQSYTNPFFANGINTINEANGECRIDIGYYECSWDNVNKQVVRTISTVPANQPIANVCTSVDPEHGGGLNGNAYWFVVNGSIDLQGSESAVTCSGNDVHLILCDHSSFKTDGLYVNEGTTLHIYSQSYGDKMGELSSENSTEDKPGIGGESDHMGVLIIHGGDITARGGRFAAGIGGCKNRTGHNITIYGGKIDAKGGSRGAGIGGGWGGSAQGIAIYGGDITAKGGSWAAGIGGGYYYYGGGDCTGLVIYGGTITAKGGGGAAGIGGGQWGSSTVGTPDPSHVSITIHGGTITATGGESEKESKKLIPGGAGIGGGAGAGITSITINGGTITATAEHHGAGIGSGGVANQEGTITINGGIIHATGGSQYLGIYYGGAGIGAGCNKYLENTGDGNDVIINGGVIYAQGGLGDEGNGVAIGHGGGSTTNGPLSLPDNYSVKAGSSSSTATLQTASNREAGCRQLYAQIEPCIHDGATFTDNGNGVDFSNCSHCLTGSGTEPYTFQTAGNWNVNTNWFGSIMPGEGKDVTVKAAATIPNNCIANVGNVDLQEDGSLTITDSGQLKHSNAGVVATVEKNITAYNGNGGYYLLTNPVANEQDPSTLGMLDNDNDLYWFDQSQELEWRNYEQ